MIWWRRRIWHVEEKREEKRCDTSFVLPRHAGIISPPCTTFHPAGITVRSGVDSREWKQRSDCNQAAGYYRTSPHLNKGQNYVTFTSVSVNLLYFYCCSSSKMKLLSKFANLQKVSGFIQFHAAFGIRTIM